MIDERLLNRVRELRAQGYAPAEVARALAISKSEATQLIRAVAAESQGAVSGRAADPVRCWINPGWRQGLRIDGHDDWPDEEDDAQVGGIAVVMTARPCGRDQLQVCTFLVDTWCLGVKNAMGPKRMRTREFDAARLHHYEPWHSQGLAVPLEMGQHLVLGAVEFARELGFEPHPDFRRACPALGSWSGPSAITFGKDGRPHYVSGPYDDPQRVLATLERAVGRGGFHYSAVLIDTGEDLSHAA